MDPQLRKDFEAAVQNSNEIARNDFAAALQLISKLEVDDTLLNHTQDRMKLLQTRIGEGPLTENHFRVLKLLCDSEVHTTSIPVNPEAASQPTIQDTLHSDPEITEDKVFFDKPLLDVLLLLNTCDLEPSYLLHNESRKLIEDNLSNRQGPLPAEHLAVMQLISKAEIESGLSMDFLRKSLLEKRIKEGPLNADHLNASLSLRQIEAGKLPQMVPIVPAASGEAGTSQLSSAAKQHEGSEVQNKVGSDVAAGHGGLAQEIKAPFFLDTISGLEVKTSLLSREEKSALQLIELRAKTARIRQSLPEWVKKGLVPPPLNRTPSQRPQPAVVLAKSLANVADQHAKDGAVQISSRVQADFVFIDNFVPRAAQAKLQKDHDPQENLYVEQKMDIDEPQPVGPAPGWQTGPLAGEVLGPGLSSTPPSRSGSESSLIWIWSALAQGVSSCFLTVLGACSSGLGCLTGLGKCPGSGDRG
jgi:hypothetical protein